MVEAALTSPFGDEQVNEVLLSETPLVRVVTQVRFPRLSALASGDEAASTFAAAVRSDFPILNESREMEVTITPEGITQAPGAGRTWQLQSADEKWQVSFGDAFFAVDTANYSGRADFSTRVGEVWRAFNDIVAPPFTQRVGVRYINRITDPDRLDELSTLVRPEVLGGLGVPLGGVQLGHSMSEALYQVGEQDGLQARWGMLPPGAILDPTLSAVSERSWVLDLDSFRVDRGAADSAVVASQVTDLAERAYRYFRWVVTPEFLERFGGGAA